MAIYRMQVSFGADADTPRDRFVITPHFKVTLSPTPQQLTDDLAAALGTWLGNLREGEVKAYDAEGTKPNPPLAIKTVNKGLVPAGTKPRELCLCLSFYGDANTKRKRGRLYFPAEF